MSYKVKEIASAGPVGPPGPGTGDGKARRRNGVVRSKYAALLLNDLRQGWRDPMLLAGIIGPLALVAIVRYLYPPISEWVALQLHFRLEPYDGFAASLLASVIPMLLGMMSGLLMLDERDANLIAYYAVTPLGRGGYLAYRLALPCLACIACLGLFVGASGLFGDADGLSIPVLHPLHLGAVLLLALEAPLFALLLASFASNKVEGLALSKLGGLLIAGPIAAFFAPGAWGLLGAWIPSYWPAAMWLKAGGSAAEAAGYFIAGLLVHAAMLYGMLRTFKRRTD